MADIGDKLRSAREAKGLSIEDIEKATKIQSRYLTAIENNEFDKLPGDFYVRAFIRQYAQVVGLDGKELLSEYHQDVPESKPDEYVENSIDNKQEEVRETTDNKKDLWKNYLPKIAIGLGVIVAILIVYVLYARLSSGGQHNDKANNVTVSSQTSSSSSKKKPTVKTSSVKVSQVGEDEYRITGLKNNRNLVVKAGNQTVTATISVNGNNQWSQTLAANAKHTMAIPSDAKTVVVTLSNDTDTKVTVAGKKIPYAQKGSNLTLTLLIGKKTKHSSSNSDSSSNSSTTTNTDNYTTNNGNTTTHSNNTQSQTHQSTQRQTHQSSTQRQTQSSTTTQSNTQNNNQHQEQTQSSAEQHTQSSSAATTNNANNTQNNNGDK